MQSSGEATKTCEHRLWREHVWYNDKLKLRAVRSLRLEIFSFIFDVHRAVHRNINSIVKPTRCTSVWKLFYFGMTLYMFRTVFPSITRSSRLYIQRQAFVTQILLSACYQADSSICLVAVYTILNSWWWTERPSETCRVSFQNKMNFIHWCI